MLARLHAENGCPRCNATWDAVDGFWGHEWHRVSEAPDGTPTYKITLYSCRRCGFVCKGV